MFTKNNIMFIQPHNTTYNKNQIIQLIKDFIISGNIDIDLNGSKMMKIIIIKNSHLIKIFM